MGLKSRMVWCRVRVRLRVSSKFFLQNFQKDRNMALEESFTARNIAAPKDTRFPYFWQNAKFVMRKVAQEGADSWTPSFPKSISELVDVYNQKVGHTVKTRVSNVAYRLMLSENVAAKLHSVYVICSVVVGRKFYSYVSPDLHGRCHNLSRFRL